MNFGIGAKLVVLATTLVCVTAFLLLWSMKHGSSEIVLKHEVIDLGDETELRAWELLSEIYAVRGDVDFLAREEQVGQLQTRVPGDEERAKLEKLCRDRFYQPNYLWMEIVSVDADGQSKTIVALQEPADPLPGFRQAVWVENRDNFLERVLHHVPNGTAGNQPIVSEIRRAAIRYAGSQDTDRANIVWAGRHLMPSPADPTAQHVAVIAAMDLDANIPTGISGSDDDRSPLRRMNTSPRHLGVIANEPENGRPFTDDLLVYPDEAELQLIGQEDLVKPFTELCA